MSTTIRVGYIGMATQELRAALANYGFHPTFSVNDPNLFDAWVNAAVKAFQLSKGLPSDGIVGPNTWNALYGGRNNPFVTRPADGAVSSSPSTQPAPGALPDTLGPPVPPKKPMNMSVLFAGGIAAVALWFWFKKKKSSGGALADLPFGLGWSGKSLGSAEDDAEEKRRKARIARARKERRADIEALFQSELIRKEIDPIRAPGHAKALLARIEKAADTEERVTHQSVIIPAETEALAKGPRGGKQKLPKGGERYRKEYFTKASTPARALRNRLPEEEDAWVERPDTSAKGAAHSTKRITVVSRRYHTDKAYREREQDDARRLADEGHREVQLVNERGVPLFKYQPNIRSTFKDITSERLIEAVEADAKKGNCPKAVMNLFRVRPLALDKKTEDLLNKAASAVERHCTDELHADAGERQEARDEAGQFTRTTAKLREVQHEVGLKRSKALKEAVFTPQAIKRMVQRGTISEEDGKALMIQARDEARRIERERQGVFEPGSSSAKYVRRRKGELEAHVYTSPGGRTRTLRK